MRISPRAIARLEQVSAVLGYALGYWLLRQVSVAGWTPFSGFRLFVLLLTPYRVWPALCLGEMIPLAYVAIHWGPLYSWPWAVVMVQPPILFAMPIVKWARERGRLFQPDGRSYHVSMNVMLLCAALVSTVWMATAMAALIQLPDKFGPVPYGRLAAEYFLGNYIGTLTIVPVGLAVRQELLIGSWRRIWRNLADSRLVLETLSLLIPLLGVLAWLAVKGTPELSDAARMAMFLPVAWLSLRHGWRGAAVGGAIASVVVAACMPTRHDASTIRAEVFIAFTITTMLLLGARIAILNRLERGRREEFKSALALARRNVYLGELQLSRASSALWEIGKAVEVAQGLMLSERQVISPQKSDRRHPGRNAVTAPQQVYRLADTLHALEWRLGGLAQALGRGPLHRIMSDMGVAYRWQLSDKKIRLSPMFEMALYRLAFEAAGLLCTRPVREIRLKVRLGRYHGRVWAAIVADGDPGAELKQDQAVQADTSLLIPQEALSNFGSAVGVADLKDRAAVFEGTARRRLLARGQRISLIIYDPGLEA